MKNLFVSFAATVSLIIIGCKDDSEINTPSQNYFEFIAEDTIYPDEKIFIILNSENGNVLQCKEIFYHQTCRFDLPEFTGKEKYIVQKLKVDEQDHHWGIECFLDVKPQSWRFTKFKYYYIYYPVQHPNEKPSQIGIETIVFNKDLMIHSSTGDRVPIYSLANRYDAKGYDTQVNDSTFVLKQYCNPDNLFIALRENNNTPLYKWINNDGLNASISLSRQDFDAVTDSLNITFPSNIKCSAYIGSDYDPSTDYRNFDIFNGSGKDTTLLKVYFPKNTFLGYWTKLSSTISESSNESYAIRRGPIPNSFKQINADMEINNSFFTQFSATTTGNADFVELNWNYFLYGDFKNYKVVGSLYSINQFVAPKIPDSLIVNYNINLNILDNPSSVDFSLYENDVYEGFDDYIQDMFVNPEELMKKVNEYHSKTVFWAVYHPYK